METLNSDNLIEIIKKTDYSTFCSMSILNKNINSKIKTYFNYKDVKKFFLDKKVQIPKSQKCEIGRIFYQNQDKYVITFIPLKADNIRVYDYYHANKVLCKNSKFIFYDKYDCIRIAFNLYSTLNFETKNNKKYTNKR